MYSSSFSIIVHAPIQKVWDAWTKPEQLKQFFFGTDMETSWNVGDPIYFRGAWEEKTYEDKGVVLAFEPLKTLSYSYWSSMSGTEDVPENYMTITMNFEETSEGTKLSVTQSNVTTQEAADHSAASWNHIAGLMKDFVEKQ